MQLMPATAATNQPLCNKFRHRNRWDHKSKVSPLISHKANESIRSSDLQQLIELQVLRGFPLLGRLALLLQVLLAHRGAREGPGVGGAVPIHLPKLGSQPAHETNVMIVMLMALARNWGVERVERDDEPCVLGLASLASAGGVPDFLGGFGRLRALRRLGPSKNSPNLQELEPGWCGEQPDLSAPPPWTATWRSWQTCH